MALATMMGSRFITGVQSSVEYWEKKLALLSETLDEWVTTQRNWMYLETIFGAEDIQRQLPAEAQKFMAIDKAWKNIMKKTHDNPKVINDLKGGMGTDGGNARTWPPLIKLRQLIMHAWLPRANATIPK